MQRVEETVPNQAEILKNLLSTPIGRSLLHYVALNEDNFEHPGHHPFLDRGVLAELKRLIEMQLAVLYNVLDNSMEATHSASKHLHKYLSLFVSLIESIDNEHVAAFLDQRRYESDQLPVRFPIVLQKLSQEGGNKIIAVLSRHQSGQDSELLGMLLRGYFAAVMDAPSQITNSFQQEDIQQLAHTARRVETAFGSQFSDPEQAEIDDLHTRVRLLLIGDGSEPQLLRLVETILELEDSQRYDELVCLVLSIEYLFGMPQYSRDGDHDLMQTIILSIIKERRNSSHGQSLALALLLLSSFNVLDVLNEVSRIWYQDTRTGYYVPNLQVFRNSIERTCSDNLFQDLISNILLCCLNERFIRNQNDFQHSPFGPFLGLGPPIVVADVISSTKRILLRSFYLLSLTLINHPNPQQCLDSLDQLLSGRLPTSPHQEIVFPILDANQLFIQDLNHDYFINIIRNVSTKGHVNLDCKLDLAVIKHRHSVLKQLNLIQTMAQSIVLSSGADLLKPSLVWQMGNKWKESLSTINISKVPPAKYISHMTPVETANIEQQVRQQEWNLRQDAKMRLQMHYAKLLAEPPKAPRLKLLQPSTSEAPKPPVIEKSKQNTFTSDLQALKALNAQISLKRAQFMG